MSHEKNGLGKVCLRRIFIIIIIRVTRGSLARWEIIRIIGGELGAYRDFSILLNWRSGGAPTSVLAQEGFRRGGMVQKRV